MHQSLIKKVFLELYHLGDGHLVVRVNKLKGQVYPTQNPQHQAKNVSWE